MSTPYNMTDLHAKHSVYGIYPSRSLAEKAVGELKFAGFSASDLSVVIPGNAPAPVDPANKAVDNAEMGAMVGGLFGWIAGIGAMAIPGLGMAVAAGPIGWAVLTVGAMTGAGGVIGGLLGLGIPEKESHLYHGRLHKGDILLSVHCADSALISQAKEVLVRTGAEDVYTRDAAVKAA